MIKFKEGETDLSAGCEFSENNYSPEQLVELEKIKSAITPFEWNAKEAAEKLFIILVEGREAVLLFDNKEEFPFKIDKRYDYWNTDYLLSLLFNIITTKQERFNQTVVGLEFKA